MPPEGKKACAYPHCAYGAYHGAVADSVDIIKGDVKEFKNDIKALTTSIQEGFRQFGLIMGLIEGMQKAQSRVERDFDKIFDRLRKVESVHVSNGTISKIKKTRTDKIWDIAKIAGAAGLGFIAAKLGGA